MLSPSPKTFARIEPHLAGLVVVGVLGALVALGVMGAGACQAVPVDNGAGGRVLAPSGVIEGTVVYQGPHPCSQNGHVVGNLILLFFDQNNPPPPAGVASTAVNFGVVQGDVLFQNEPVSGASALYCPKDHGDTETITVSAPFSVSPFGAGTYIVEAFFDYQGAFLPTFKFRELPEMGDIAGGYIDTTDAILHADAGVDYKPIFLPITVGVPLGSVDAGLEASTGAGIRSFADAGPDSGPPPELDGGTLVLPPNGYVANNITVSVGSVLPLARPYFYVNGVTGPASAPKKTTANPNGDVAYVPAATMAQDIKILGQPPLEDLTPAAITAFQASLVSMTFNAGLPSSELSAAVDPGGPFQFQLSKATNATSLFVWTDGTSVPESTLISNLLPQVVFTKLIDDKDHTLDPQSLTQQIPPTGPIVVILGLNMGPETSLLDLLSYPQKAPGPMATSSMVNALVRPVAVCVDPTKPEQGATFVTPFFNGTLAGTNPPMTGPLFDAETILAALTPIFGRMNAPVQGCLPPGRYAPNFVYPTGQAWTVPNESGSCAASEGKAESTSSSPTGFACVGDAGPGRSVLPSQGPRAVLEVTESPGSAQCAKYPVPSVCLPAPH